jgi:zinc protease
MDSRLRGNDRIVTLSMKAPIPMPSGLILDHCEETTLRCGAKLIYKHLPGAPRLAFGIYLPGGNRLDRISGEADLRDRLMTKGTADKDQEAIATALDSLSLEMDVDTKRDYSILSGTLLPEDLDESLALSMELMFQSTFYELEREKFKIAGEIQMELDSPRARASDMLVRHIFGHTAYGVVGTVFLENLEKFTSPDWFAARQSAVYHPSRWVVVVSGDTTVDTLSKAFDAAVEPYLAQLGTPEPNDTLDLSGVVIPADHTLTFARDDSNQAHIFQAWMGPTMTHADYTPLVVMNTILGGAGLSSRMFVELRDKQGLAYNVRSALEGFKDCGLISLYIGTNPENKQKCLDGFKTEIQKLIDTPVPADELADAKRNVLGRRKVYLETAGQQAGYLGSNLLLGRTFADLERLDDAIQAVTPDDIQRVTHTYFSKPSVVSIVAPSSVL